MHYNWLSPSNRFWGSPYLTVIKPSSQDMRQVKQGGNHWTWEGKKKTTNGYLKASLGVTTQRSTSYMIFGLLLWIWEGRNNRNFTFLSWPGTAEIWESRLQQEFSPIAGLRHFPHHTIGSEWGVQVGLILVKHHLWRRKNNFLFSLWWVLSRDPFISRTPHNGRRGRGKLM